MAATTTFSLSDLTGPPQSTDDRIANPPFEMLIRRLEGVIADPTPERITNLETASLTAELGAFDGGSLVWDRHRIIGSIKSGLTAEPTDDAFSARRVSDVFSGPKLRQQLYRLGLAQWCYDNTLGTVPTEIAAGIRTLSERPAAMAVRYLQESKRTRSSRPTRNTSRAGEASKRPPKVKTRKTRKYGKILCWSKAVLSGDSGVEFD